MRTEQALARRRAKDAESKRANRQADPERVRAIEKSYYDRNRQAILQRKKKRWRDNVCNVQEKNREYKRRSRVKRKRLRPA